MWQVGDKPVPGYQLESLLGSGSNAVVWRASGPGQTAAALKFISLGGKLGLKEFRGVQRVKEISHANLLPITAFWILDRNNRVLDNEALESLSEKAHGRKAPPMDFSGTMQANSPHPQARQPETVRPETLILAMLLGGQNLDEVLQRHQQAGREGIPVDELLCYMEDAAKGIDFLNSPIHDLGAGPVAIQHCDIKPQNIVLRGNSAMVCDFGLARVLGGASNTHTINDPVGTPCYIAPESIRGEKPQPTTDQYSLAITYFELRIGTLPFSASSVSDVCEIHLEGRLELDRLPPAERAVIRRATSVQPDQRYPSTLEMVQVLRRAVEQKIVSPEGRRQPRDATPGDVFSDVANQPTPDAVAREMEPVSRGSDSRGAARRLLARGTSFFEQGDVKAAIAEFDEAIDLDPNLAEAYYGRAVASSASTDSRQDSAGEHNHQAHNHFADGDFSQAIIDFTEAIQISPALAEANQGRLLRNRAVAYRNQRLYDKAIDDYNRVIRLYPRFARPYHNRALVHRDKGDIGKAITDCLEAIRLTSAENRPQYNRDLASMYRERGDAAFDAGDFPKALADYNEAVRLRPDWGIVYNQRGRTHGAAGNYDAAVRDYTRCIEFDAEYAHLYFFNRGSAHFKNGDYEKAIDDLTAAIDRRPGYAKAYRRRSRVYEKLGEDTKATTDLAKAKLLG